MSASENENERRRFFRLDDEICLEYDLISEEAYANAENELAQIEQSAFSLSADFATLSFEYNLTLNNIKSTHPDIGQYFDLLNRKLDALSRHLLDDETPCDEATKQLVNISASGIAFDSTKELKDKQPLRLRIILLPEKIGIVVFGRVCFSNKKNKHRVSVDFEHIRNGDQELMIKHNLNKQMHALRQRSEENEES